MTRDQGIWKTGALAVAATLIFAFVIFRMAGRSREANEAVAADGQPGETAAVFPGGPNLTMIMPQIVAGSYDGGVTKYKTTIEIVNAGAASIIVRGNFYNQDGTASTVVKTTNLPSTPTLTATLDSTAVAAKGVFLITAESALPGQTGWARIVTSGGAAVSATVELRDAASGILHSRIGIGSSPADMASFVIPWTRNVAAGLDTGFAIVNTGTSAATLAGTVRDASGRLIAAQTISLPAGSHTAGFTAQLFNSTGCSPCLSSAAGAGESPGAVYGSMTFTSTSAQFAALGLAVEGITLSTAPVERLQ